MGEVTPNTLGRVVTFYSFKGGVGRSFALADVAVLLARWGYRVVAMDWDLEAPGLDIYFQKLGARVGAPGVLEWVSAFGEGNAADGDAGPEIQSLDIHGAGKLDFVCAGSGDAGYITALQLLDWTALYQRHFGNHLERLRASWTTQYDFVLIDSRTGLSDIGGICTVQLPDIVVALFTPNEQSISGTQRVLRGAQAGQQKLRIDRAALRVVPVQTRVDMSEYEARRRWNDRVLDVLGPFVPEWEVDPAPNVPIAQILDLL